MIKRFFNDIEIFTEIPAGYYPAPWVGSPLCGHVMICNGSPLKGGKYALLRIVEKWIFDGTKDAEKVREVV